MNIEAFARTLADLAADLPTGHATAWAEVLTTAAGPTRSVEADLIDARPGYAATVAARRLVETWRSHAADLPGAAVAVALRSASEAERRADTRRATVAVSGPSSPSAPVRLTRSVIVDVIRSAQNRLLVVSFAAYGVAEVVRELAAAADRGVRLDLVLEETRADGGTLRGTSSAATTFAAIRQKATLWHWPAHRRPAAGNSRAALHAKFGRRRHRGRLDQQRQSHRPRDVPQPRGRRRPTRPAHRRQTRRPLRRPHEPASSHARAARGRGQSER